ncbi:hypothetical protein CJ739_2861 [Mariniflexile rhizosphaerae]|nr:hypothetical protein CJ739_2861 [Mariniflexile sp. TRM1-10]
MYFKVLIKLLEMILKFNTEYKKLLVLANPKLVARLLASDFPSENPRLKTCNFTQTCWQ